MAELRSRGVQLEGVEIVPNKKSFFWSGRYHLDMNSRDTLVTDLNVLADFIQSYHTISVKVTGHCNRLSDDEMTKSGLLSDQLTERQASAVASYLVLRRINTRLIYAVGRGNRDPIAWAGSREGRRLNRRVEVIFRYYRDNTAWY